MQARAGPVVSLTISYTILLINVSRSAGLFYGN